MPKGLRIEWHAGDSWVGAGTLFSDHMVELKCPKLLGMKPSKKFYFTLEGWEKFGKNTLKLILKSKTPVRVTKVKMHRPLYRDKYQFVQ